MKKWILIGSLTAAIVVVATILTINLWPKTQPVATVIAEQNTTSNESADPIQAPVTVPEEQTVVTPPTPVKTPPVAPEAAKTPTNEELKIQYGWVGSIYSDSLDTIISIFPQYFTDSERETSFKYLNDIANSDYIKAQANGSPGILYMYVGFRSGGFPEKLTRWINYGKGAGLDTSRYQ